MACNTSFYILMKIEDIFKQKNNLKLLTLLTVFSVTSFLLPSNVSASGNSGIEIGLPAYVFPNDPFIQDLVDPSKTPTPPSIVVVNIANGDGDVSIMDDAADAIRARKTEYGENVKVIGYVYTSRANRPMSEVEESIDRWLTPRNGKVHYDGIFFDETTRDCGNAEEPMLYRDYYRTLREYVWDQIPEIEDLVVNNPGTAIDVCYLERRHVTADTFVTFEGDVDTYSQIAGPENNYVGYAGGNVFDSTGYHDGSSNWGSWRFWHLVYATDSSQMEDVVETAFDRYAGYVDVTDDEFTGVYLNPWDAKPSYLNDAIDFASTLGP